MELKKSLLNISIRFGMEDQREIISAVWKVNRAINDVLQATRKNNFTIDIYLTIDIEDDKIDPRSDKRIEEV